MRRLAILVSYSGSGGVERVVNLLAGELAKSVPVDLLTIKFKGPHTAQIPANVRLIRLKSTHAHRATGEIADYLRSERPALLLAAKDRAGRAAIAARDRSGVDVPVWLQLHTNMSKSLAQVPWLFRGLRLRAMKRDYARADGIVAVSGGVRDDLIALCGLDPARISVIHNPAVPMDLDKRAAEDVHDPWLSDPSCPLIMGMGRLTAQKDFATLIRAFARLRAQKPLRLVILGEGALRRELEAQISALGLAESVRLPGFVANPYAWLRHANLFVLSSRWEGFGNVLAEALALGIPCVSTDCPSGPAEILQQGAVGPLVPVGDDALLADAMSRVLHAPAPAAALKQAAAPFGADVAARLYLERLRLETLCGAL